jgi:hypothetical protein
MNQTTQTILILGGFAVLAVVLMTVLKPKPAPAPPAPAPSNALSGLGSLLSTGLSILG